MTLRVLRFRIAPVACAARGHDDAVLLRRSKAGRPAGDKPGPPAARPSGVVNGDAERGTTRRPPATIQDHTPSFDTPSFDTPSFDTASFGTASFGTASLDAASLDAASLDAASFNQSRQHKTMGVSAQHAAFPGQLGRRAGVPMP